MPIPIGVALLAKKIIVTTILVMGARLLGRALQKKTRSAPSYYGWDVSHGDSDKSYPWVFGRMKVSGQPFSQYRNITHTSYHNVTGWQRFWDGVPDPITPGSERWNVDYSVRGCSEKLNVRIAVSEGIIQGFVPGKAILDGKRLSDISGITTTERVGTQNQTATGQGDCLEFPQDIPVVAGNPVTVTMPTSDYSACAIIISFPNGLVRFDKDGDKVNTPAGVKIEIRELGGSWHTLFDYYLYGCSTSPVFYTFLNTGTYSNGSPFVVTEGVQHEWRVTYTDVYTKAYAKDLVVSAVQAIYGDGYTYPGLAYREIQAIATQSLSGSLKYEDIIDGLILESPNGSVIEHSSNPARVARYLITRPVIRLEDGLVGHWKLNDNAADTTVVDSSGNGRTGTATSNTNTFSVSGVIDRAFQFVSANQQDVVISHHSSLNMPGGGSVAFWVKLNAWSSNHLMGKGYGWAVIVSPTTHQFITYVHYAGQSQYSYSTPVELGVWMHVVCHFSTQSRRIYINGVDATATEAVRSNANTVTNPLVLGNWRVNAPYDYCDACLDDVRIYNRVLTNEEIRALYNNGRGTESVGNPYWVDYYRGDQPSQINELELKALEDWCDELVPDGKGGYEKRFVFNGILDTQEECKNQLDKVGAMCRANFWYDGRTYRCWIDKPTAATHIFCSANILNGTYNESSTDKQNRPKFIESTILDENTDFTTVPIRVTNVGSTDKATMKLDGLGCTRESQFVRYCKFIFDKNANNHLSYQWDMDIAGADVEPGDVGYIQDDTNGRGKGGRIVSAGTNWVQIDKELTLNPEVTYKLVVQSIDSNGKHVEAYTVSSIVEGDKVNLTSNLTYIPIAGDVYILAPESNLDRVRILTVQCKADLTYTITAEMYKDEYYARDDGTPDLDTTVYRTAVTTGKKGLQGVTKESLIYGLPEEKIFAGDEVDQLRFGGITFSAGTNGYVYWTVDQTEQQGWIRYNGFSYPIAGDSVGTTNTWIYFDPAAEDPTTLKTTSNINDLIGYDRFVLCKNVNGTPFVMPGHRITADSQKLETIQEGADVTSDHAADIVFQGTTAPDHVQGRLWLNTNWCGASCVGHWRLNDNTATKIIKDETVWGHHGQSQRNASEMTTTGKIGTGLLFNGTTDYISVPDSQALTVGMGDVSGAIWFKSTVVQTHRLMSKRDLSSGSGWDFYVYSDGKLGLYLKDIDGNVVSRTWDHGRSVFDGEWHFAAFSVNRTEGARLFWDDAIFNTYSVSTLTAALTPSGTPLEIGRYATSYCNGALDNAMVFRRALTLTDVTALYNAGAGTEQFCVGSTRALLRSDGTRWLLADSDSATIPRTADEIAETEERKWAGESGADVTSDSPVDAFRDTFDDPLGNLTTRWVKVDGGGTLSTESGGVAGGKMLKVTYPLLGTGEAYLIYHKSIAYDPSKLYRLRVRVKRTAGNGTCYFGVVGRNLDDTQYVNCDGNNSLANQHWIAGNGVSPGSDWVTYTGYFTGKVGSVSPGWYSDPAYPAALHSNVCYFRPAMVVNYHNVSGTTYVDEFSIDVIPEQVQDVNPTVFAFGAYGDDDHDDTAAIQAMIDYSIDTGRPCILPKPEVAYKITDTLHIGDGVSGVSGLTIQSEGGEFARIRWHGSTNKNMIELLSCSNTKIDNVWLDGNSIDGVNGIYHTTNENIPSQHTVLDRVCILNCKGIGYRVRQWSMSATCDYLSFYNCILYNNGTNLKIEGGVRQVEMFGGSNIAAATYGVNLVDGRFTVYEGFFGLNGYDFQTQTQVGSDLYISGEIAQIQVFGASTESLVFLDGDWEHDAGWSRLLSHNTIYNLNQASHDLLGGPEAIGTVIKYDCARPLVLMGCKLMGDIYLGSRCSSVQSISTEFYNYTRPADGSNPIVGFYGPGKYRLNLLGETETSVGTGWVNPTAMLGGGRLRVVEDGWFKGIDILDNGETVYRRMGFSDGPPDTYYARQGWIVFAVNPTEAGALGWVCVQPGVPTTSKAVFLPFGTNLIGATVSDYIRYNILPAVDSAGARTALELGSLATQNSNSVSISGGTITGITDLAITDGGTGASTAVDARTNLGIGTTDSPQFAGINVGHASDTTITRVSAGNIAVEGKTIYRVDGTDVAVADGGTGASTAAGARTNLGIGTADSPQFAGLNVGHASDTTITRVSAGDIAVEGKTIYRADGTDVAVADGGTGSSTAAGARTNLGIGSIATLADAPTAITSNTSASSSDSGKHYTNTGATGTIALTLPSATAGLIFAVTRTATQAFWIKPYSGQQFRGQVANKYLELVDDGMTVVCKCIQTGIWDIVAAGVGSTAWIGP